MTVTAGGAIEGSQAASDGAVDEVVQAKALLRDQARAKLGVTGDAKTEKFRDLLRRHNLRFYPLVALGLLTIIDEFPTYAFAVLTPEISRTLGITIGAITAVVALRALANAIGPLPIAALAQRRKRRAMLCLITAVGWSLLTVYTGLVTSLLGLAFILIAGGLATGSVQALHQPLLVDSYHPDTRVRVLSAYHAFNKAGLIISPALVGLLTGVMGLTWRGAFIVLGVISTVTTLIALRLKDPGFGNWDTQQLRKSVHDLHGDSGVLKPEEVELGFWEVLRRLMLIPTISKLLRGFAIVGVMTVPLAVFISFFLERQFDLGPGERGLFFAYQATVAVIALGFYGSRGERLFRQDPAKVLTLAGRFLAIAIVLLALGGMSTVLWGTVLCFGLAAALVALLGPALGIATMSIVPAAMRPHVGGLIGVATAVGGLGGALFLSGISESYGAVGAMIAIAVPGVLGALVISRAGRTVKADLDRMIDDVLEEEELSRIRASGAKLPLLSCRGIDFSYGQLQVLFDVDFNVDDGEMVALLGVNGAGKSTLLKVVSGIGLPSKGSVRYRGQEITYLDAERRVALGITQIPGGKAVFGPMTVVENLRSYGYLLPGGRKRLDASIDQCFDAFPRLAERRNSLAAQLSGGEQQMLALSKALILRPKLLIIDELSLGLAPVIVGQLLDMVRRINATGTAVVLVEQSVNIALNLVDHAYFMEKGEMKFDGASQDLLARDDLLRAVFLTGAAAADGAR